MTQPSASTFWRFILAAILSFALYAIWSLIETTRQLNIIVSDSKPWLFLFILLGFFVIATLALLTMTYSRAGDRFVEFLESFVTGNKLQKYLGGLFLAIGLIGFALCTSNPYFIRILGSASGARYLLLAFFSIIGMWGLRTIRTKTAWMTALIVVVLCQSVLQLFLFFLTQVTTYPFAMGWSETSRYYFPSLFLSEKVYGHKFPWPVLHPTLHLLLAPPYLFSAPLWFHRFWQVAIRFVLIGLATLPLLKRISIGNRSLRWLVGLWMFLFLFMGPIYLHLTVPVIIVLWGFSVQNERRTWLAVLLASLWAGWSRVNWYPVPGVIAAVLYFLEEPIAGKQLWNYLFKPCLWFIVGTSVALVSQRIYIALSGIDSTLFYSSLSSDLLWYRLWPNASYSLGLILAIFLASLPMWLAIYWVLRTDKKEAWHPIRLFLIVAALFVLLVGGLLVSLKIGGGVDLHNFDAYFCVLLIVFSYLVFARYRLENEELSPRVTLPWFLVLAVIVMPAWSYLHSNISFKTYEEPKTAAVLQSLQNYVDNANAQQGQTLFITQRQLISMHMLKNVTLVPDYEREDLMEMAMANNTKYLAKFRKDMEDQRFALIVVDPLNFNIMSRNRSFADENNVWVRRVMKQILCNYRQEAIFAEDDIALYVPQKGTRQCPQLK